VSVREGEAPRSIAFERVTSPAGPASVTSAPVERPASTWLYDPFPLPAFRAADLDGKVRSLSDLAGRPAVLLFWSVESEASRRAVAALAEGTSALGNAGIGILAIALDAAAAEPRVRAAAGTLPTVLASRDLGAQFAIVNRFLYMNRQPLDLPTAYLLDPAAHVVKVYRRGVEVREIVRDASGIDALPRDRLERALPFPGLAVSAPSVRNYVPYGGELLDEGLDEAALGAFERASASSPNAFALYRLGTLLERRGEPARAKATLERALGLQPDLAEASNDLGTLLAREGDLEGAITRFRGALAASPDYPDALNNLGYALLLAGQDQEARRLYERALVLQPDFPEALNNLGMLLGRAGALDEAEQYFRRALERRAEYGEAATNLALVLAARGRAADAVALLEKFVTQTPQYDTAYLTLARIHFSQGRDQDGIAVLERLLQRNPSNKAGLELLRQFKPR
jgi:Flp pilus assembly protein TadD/peroxiredoxin